MQHCDVGLVSPSGILHVNYFRSIMTLLLLQLSGFQRRATSICALQCLLNDFFFIFFSLFVLQVNIDLSKALFFIVSTQQYLWRTLQSYGRVLQYLQRTQQSTHEYPRQYHKGYMEGIYRELSNTIEVLVIPWTTNGTQQYHDNNPQRTLTKSPSSISIEDLTSPWRTSAHWRTNGGPNNTKGEPLNLNIRSSDHGPKFLIDSSQRSSQGAKRLRHCLSFQIVVL